MEDNPTLYLKEATKGCVRIGLFQTLLSGSEPRYGVTVVAWNAWAQQGKIIACAGGIERETAELLFESIVQDIRDFDWMSGEVVLEEAAA